MIRLTIPMGELKHTLQSRRIEPSRAIAPAPAC